MKSRSKRGSPAPIAAAALFLLAFTAPFALTGCAKPVAADQVEVVYYYLPG